MEERWARIKAEHQCQLVPASWLPRSRAQLEAESPSRLDGLSPADEFYLRKSYCELLAEGGKRLKMCVNTFLISVASLWSPAIVLSGHSRNSHNAMWGAQVAVGHCHSDGHLPPLLCHQIHAPQRLLRASPAKSCLHSSFLGCSSMHTSRAVSCPCAQKHHHAWCHGLMWELHSGVCPGKACVLLPTGGGLRSAAAGRQDGGVAQVAAQCAQDNVRSALRCAAERGRARSGAAAHAPVALLSKLPRRMLP